MKVLLIGANGYLGPHVVKALAPHHRLRITDVKPAADDIRRQYSSHEFFNLDVTSPDQVLQGADGVDAIINLSVIRGHPVLAFQVNMLGCRNVMEAAVRHAVRRVIHTGPYFAVAGPSYDLFDFAISPDVPPHPGTALYPITKSLGLEISRIYTQRHDVYVQEYLYYNFCSRQELKPGQGGVPFMVSWSDAAEVFRLGLEIDLARLPSKCEVFFILGDCPQERFLGEKARRILGFQPKDDVSVLWRNSR
jgi:UDP-glucose 4-epimerase